MRETGHRIRRSDIREKLRFYRFAGETAILLAIITGVTMVLSQIGVLVELEQTIDDIGVAVEDLEHGRVAGRSILVFD